MLRGKSVRTVYSLAIMTLGFFVSILLNIGAAAQSAPPATQQYLPIKIDLAGNNLIGKKALAAGAKNEYMILSYLVTGADVPSLKVQVQGPAAGDRINFTFYQVCGAPARNPYGYQPDALFPLGQEPQPSGVAEVWVIAKMPANISKGIHHYELIFSDKKATFRQPLEIKVWNFSLANDLPITIEANLFVDENWFARYGVKTQRQYDETIRAYLRNMREYKINALGKFYPFPGNQLTPGKRVEDFTGFDQMQHYVADDLHYRYFRVPRFGGAKEMDRPGSDWLARAKIFFPLFAEYLRRHNWEQRAIIKIIDEPKPNTYQQVYQAYAAVKTWVPGIRTESAGREPDPLLAKVINIWVNAANFYNPDRVAAAKKSGQEIWLYANRLHGIDRPLVQQRMIGWYLFQYDFSGYLFWGLDHWLSDPWRTDKLPFDKYRYRRGAFYYPDPRTGMPIPTTRLESLRRGFQDYQYLRMFNEAYHKGKISQGVFRNVSQKVVSVTRDLNAQNPQVSMQQLDEIRYQIGEALDQ